MTTLSDRQRHASGKVTTLYDENNRAWFIYKSKDDNKWRSWREDHSMSSVGFATKEACIADLQRFFDTPLTK